MNQPFRIVTDSPVEVTSVSAEWPAPDKSVLRSGRRLAPEFPVEILGPWKDFVVHAADGAGAPVDYVAAALLSSISALTGNARSVSPWQDWEEPAVLWVGAVGDPSTGKSPAFDLVLKALRKVERDLSFDFADIHLDWSTKKEMAKAIEDDWKSQLATAAKSDQLPPAKPAGAVAPDEPKPTRILVSDATPEALAEVLVANPKGVLHYRDELTGWLSSFKRYTSGDSRGLWIEAFGARPYRIDRKTSGNIQIPRLAVSVLGGIQPDRLHGILFDADDDGLAARFLWLWPEKRPFKRPHTFAALPFIAEAFERLNQLKVEEDMEWGLRPRVLMLASDAIEAFVKWRVEHSNGEGAISGILGSAWGKMPGVLLRLSLLFEIGWWSAKGGLEPKEVSLDAMQNAITFIEDYIKPMSEKVYGDAALPTADRDAAMLGKWLLAKGVSSFNARELRRTVALPGLREWQAIDAATTSLIEAHWIRPSLAGSGPGRKPKSFDVNPAINQFKS